MKRDDEQTSGKPPDQLSDEQEPGGDSEAARSGADSDHTDPEHLRMLFGEKLIPEILRRGIESGMDTFLRSDRGVRKVISDLKLRRELTNYFFHQIDDTKNAALRVIAHEVRGFLENTNLEQALYSVLTSVAFEIRTDVRFVPSEDGPLRPKVKSKLERASKKKTAARKKDKKSTGGAKKKSTKRSNGGR
jgi:hypothetical protein